MNTGHTERRLLQVSQEKVLALVGALVRGRSGREDDEHPLPPGPWDPVIRAGLERIAVLGPRPEPWLTRQSVFNPSPGPWKVVLASLLAKYPEIFDAIGGGHSLIEKIALNPQPLPPRFAFLAAVAGVVISRAEFFQEIADATSREGDQRGITTVGGYIARFTDEFCPYFRPRWPFPEPPPSWFANELDGVDLLVIASQFEQAAKETFGADLRKNFANAGARLAEAGMSKMQ